MRALTKPLWNVCAVSRDARRTTLKQEAEERRYASGRPSFCVTASSDQEARDLVAEYERQTKHSIDRGISIFEHRGIPIIMGAPSW